MTTRDVKLMLRAAMNGPLAQSLRDKGLAYRVIFGVEWPRLVSLAQEIGQDHQLAQDLWKEDIRECRLLAGLVQPTETFYADIADIWLESMRYPEEVQYTVLSLFQRLPYASDKAFVWIASPQPLTQLCGYTLLTRLFMRGDPLVPQSEREYLDQAATALEGEDTMVRKAAFDSLVRYAQTGGEQEALVDKTLHRFEQRNK